MIISDHRHALDELARRLAENGWYADARVANGASAEISRMIVTNEHMRDVIARALAALGRWTHGEDCPRGPHDEECGITVPSNPMDDDVFRCRDGLDQEECAAVKCECGIDELAAILREGRREAV